MSDFITRLARKWCWSCRAGVTENLGGAEHDRIAAAVRDALKEAERIALAEALCPEDEAYDNTEAQSIGEGTYYNQACHRIAAAIAALREGR